MNIFFHEDLVKNKDKFYKQLHKVVNIGEYLGENSLSAFEKLKNHNQRKGEIDEWKTFFDERELVLVKEHLQNLVSNDKELVELWNLEEDKI